MILPTVCLSIYNKNQGPAPAGPYIQQLIKNIIMKQIDKLYNFINNSRNYGIHKNTRVYKYICNIAYLGIATTGYSDKYKTC